MTCVISGVERAAIWCWLH